MSHELFMTLVRQLFPKIWYYHSPFPGESEHVISAADVFDVLRNLHNPPLTEAECDEIFNKIDKKVA